MLNNIIGTFNAAVEGFKAGREANKILRSPSFVEAVDNWDFSGETEGDVAAFVETFTKNPLTVKLIVDKVMSALVN